MKLLFQNGAVYDGGALLKADVLVQAGVVAAVGPALPAGGARVINAEGCVLAPAFTDVHVHLRQPGFEAKETIATGTAAAAAGGFATVCAMPNLNPVPDAPETLALQLDAIKRDAVVRVLPYGALTAGERGGQMADIPALAPHCCGFTDDGRGVQSEAMMRRCMAQAAAAGRFVAAHCELDDLLPKKGVCVQENSAFALKNGWVGHSSQSEWAEAKRDIALARETGCRLHICHASTAETFDAVRKAQAEGLPVTCEVTPHNLLLSCDDIPGDDGRFKMNPPLRTPADVAAALAALNDGTVLAVATDHAPHTAAEKAGGFAKALNGVVGLETAFPVLYTRLVLAGKTPLAALMRALNDGPRALLGEAPARLAPGEEASLVLLDVATKRPADPAAFKSKGRASPFASWVLRGWPVLTMYRGNVVYQAIND